MAVTLDRVSDTQMFVYKVKLMIFKNTLRFFKYISSFLFANKTVIYKQVFQGQRATTPKHWQHSIFRLSCLIFAQGNFCISYHQSS